MVKIKDFYKNKKVLVTGATGFKGSWLCLWLHIMGSKVYGIGNNPNTNKKLFYELGLNKKIKTSIFDIRNYVKLENLVKKIKPSMVFHLAAQPLIFTSYEKPLETFDINMRGTLNVLEVIRKNKSIKSSIFVTSDKTYENVGKIVPYKENDELGGVDPYSASKSTAELTIRAYRESFLKHSKQAVSSVRAGNVIGGGDWSENRLIPDVIRSLLNKKKIEIRNPNFNRPWQHVLEPLRGYLILANKQFHNEKFYSSAWNFGTRPNSVTSVKQIVDFITKYWKKSETTLKRNNKYYEQKNLQLDIQKAKKYLNWWPTYSIEKSVK
ncbi:CDP-glucose 4,6-dehydratase, partial [Candidatus Pelagibacter bacterium]